MSTNEKPSVNEILFGFLLAPLLIAWKGFVIHKLWGWFLVPLGVVEISVAHAVGVFMLLTISRRPKDARRGFVYDSIVGGVISYAWSLGMGYLVYLFMLQGA